MRDKRLMHVVSLAALAGMNAVFVFKYGARVLGSPPLAALLACIFAAGLFVLWTRLEKAIAKHGSKIAYRSLSALVGSFALLIFLLILFTPEDSKVTRLPAIKEWIANVSAGVFPYHTKMNPSGFPGLFFIAWPFYLLGQTGALQVLGFALFSLICARQTDSAGAAAFPIALLLTMPVFYYEAVVRSELFFNMTLILLVLFETDRAQKKGESTGKTLLLAAATGIILSTRLVAFIPWYVCMLYFFRGNEKAMLKLMAVSVSVFILTLAPFILWNPAEFVAAGPFGIQALYLPLPVIVSAPFFLFAAARKSKTISETHFRTGVFLFLLVLISFSIHAAQYGFVASIVRQPFFDISYFIFSAPFFLLALLPPHSEVRNEDTDASR